MDIRVNKLSELTASEFQACSRLTFGPEGYMYELMRTFRDDPKTFTVRILGEGVPSDVITGWALLIPTKNLTPYYASDYARRKTKYSVQMYVRYKLRRRGYGHALMGEALKFDSRPYVFPHDTTAGSFYADFNVRADADWRNSYLKKAKK